MSLEFYLTKEFVCSYKQNEMSRKLFTEITADSPYVDYVYTLIDNGFRRDHNYIYRAECKFCSECKSIRVDVKNFKPSNTERKIFNRLDKDIYVTEASSATMEHFDLYQKYENIRHTDGEMASISFENFKKMVETSPIETYLYEFRNIHTNELKSAMIIDHLPLGLSAVYSFYDVSNLKQSLGTYMILKMIKWCKTLDLPYLYLGYYVKSCKKMNYKTRFKPFEIYDNDRWQTPIPDPNLEILDDF